MVGIIGLWDYRGAKKNPWNTKMREIFDALRAIKFDPKQRHKPNIGLLFALAQWGQRQEKLPKKSLRKYLDDGSLFELLRLHRQLPPEAYGFCDLTTDQLNKLEKRLHRYWPDVALMVEAINAPRAVLRKANERRRKAKRNVHNPRQPTLSAMMSQFNS